MKLGTVVHNYILSTQGAEAGGPQVLLPPLCTLRITFKINSVYNKFYLNPSRTHYIPTQWPPPYTTGVCAQIPWTFCVGCSLSQNASPQTLSYLHLAFFKPLLKCHLLNGVSQGHFIQNTFHSQSRPGCHSSIHLSVNCSFILQCAYFLPPHRNGRPGW